MNPLKTYRRGLTHLIIVTGIALSFSAAPAFGGSVAYDFNNLTPGNLQGQDGWSTTSIYGSTATVTNGPAPNTSPSLYATVSPTSAPYGSANANHAVSAGLFTGLETDAVLQFDFNRTSSDLMGNGSLIRLGNDSNANGYLDLSESASMRFQNDVFSFDTFSGSGPGATRTSLNAGQYTDLYTMRLVMNFVTGTGQLFFRNDTRGDTSFSLATSGSLQSGSMTAPVATWNQLSVITPAGSYIDNIVLASNAASVPALVPEPSTWVLLVAGLGALFGFDRSRRRSPRLSAYRS